MKVATNILNNMMYTGTHFVVFILFGVVEVQKTKKVGKHCNKALSETESDNPTVKHFSGFHLSLMRFTLFLRIKFLRFQISQIRADENIQHIQGFYSMC